MYLSETDNALIEETTKLLYEGSLVIPEGNVRFDIIRALRNFTVPKENLKAGITDEEVKDYEKGMRYNILRNMVKEAWLKFMPVVNTPNIFGEHNKHWKEAWHNFVVYQMYL